MFIRAAGLDHHVLVDGPPGAPALLLLHSLGTAGAIWEAPARHFAGRFRVIRPDVRGHGLTAGAADTVAAFAADALAILDALGIAAAHVAGISLGGLVAQAIAATAPARVLTLTLGDTALALPPADGWRARAAAVRADGLEPLVETVVGRWVTPGALASPEAAGLRAMLRATSREGYAAAAQAVGAFDGRGNATRIAAPTLVFTGADDSVTGPDAAAQLAAAIAGARVTVIPGAAHIPTMEQPDAVIAAMEAHLAPDAPDDHGYEAGLRVRRAVLGEAHVDRATAAVTAFDRDFQHFITRTAWGGAWTRPGLDRRTRSLLTIAMMATLGREEELELHVRATPNTGTTEADVAELMIHVAVYAGIPAANAAVRLCKRVFAEMNAAREVSGR